MLKKLQGNRWAYSVFTRLIVAFLIVVLPIYGMGTAIFVVSRNQIYQQFYDGAYARMHDFFVDFENEILSTQKMLDYLVIDDDLNELARLFPFSISHTHVRSINRLRNRLTFLEDNNRYIYWVSVYVPAIGMQLNSARKNVSFNPITYKNMLQFGRYQMGSGFFSRQDSNLYLYSLPGMFLTSGTPLFVVEAQLDMDAIFERMLLDATGLEAIFYFVLPDNQFVLTNSDDSATQLLEMLYANAYINEEVLLSTMAHDTPHLFASKYSASLNAYYLKFIPEAVLLEGATPLYSWYLLMLVSAIVVTMIFSGYSYRLIKAHQKILANQAELRQLQAQVNPHFLYNSFFILRSRINKRDWIGSETYCGMLGTYFQFLTKNYHDTTTLAYELDHARVYAEIQAVRFRNRISVSIEKLPNNVENINVPKLILQPIIENAFKYGLEEMEKNGLLKVSFQLVDQKGVIIHIDDNGLAYDEEKIAHLQRLFANDEIKEPSGLLNIHKRLELFMGNGSGLGLCKSTLGGLRVSILLYPAGGI